MHSMRRHRARIQRAGFTMVELAIAIALATLIVAGLYQLFIIQSRQLQFLDMQTEMNQNLRFATDVVTRTVRLAGLGTADGARGALGDSGAGSPLSPVQGYNNALSSGPDAITVVHQDPSLIINTSPVAVYPGDTSQITFDLSMSGYPARFASYTAGEFLLCSDFANPLGMASYLWVISGTSVSGDDGHMGVLSTSSYVDYTDVMPSSSNIPPVMSCSKGEVVTFYIDDQADGVGPGSAEHPVLMMDLDYDWPEADDVPLADDIEDLQLAYCLADPSGLTPCSSSTSWNSTLASSEWPWMVRVNILARSRREEAGDNYTSSRPALEDHSASTTTDHYYRQLITTEVTLRNMRLYTNLFDT
jgi:prepilin-type N-terminal cleavage/methylation domain-containing protein